MKYQLEGIMENNHLCDQYMKYQLDGTMWNNHLRDECMKYHLEGTMEKYPFVWSVHEIPIRGNNVK
jgi:hypothetical protein